jgi:hypothetical protein
MRSPSISAFAWLTAVASLALAACDNPRELPVGAGEHPEGWADPKSAAFHAHWLHDNGDKLQGCRPCHGDDYAGGAVGTSCRTSGCHERKEGPEFCGTCHGGASGPRPTTGAHDKHLAFCAECHKVPSKVHSAGHINGKVDVVFSGLARADLSSPKYDPETKTCSGVYCHATSAPVWKPPTVTGPAPCDFCHGNPPTTHERWNRVAVPGSCTMCHPTPPGPTHLDKVLDLNPGIACDTCHGSGPLGAPPVSLDGSTDPTTRGVGAHRRHLVETLPDRIGRVASCADCHHVPASPGQAGHIDETSSAALAQVFPADGVYDPATLTCVVGCHWKRTPGPKWTDDSGDARKCDACHGFPPVLLRDGTPHTAAPPVLDACLACHVFTPTTHVDGKVDLLP